MSIMSFKHHNFRGLYSFRPFHLFINLLFYDYESTFSFSDDTCILLK